MAVRIGHASIDENGRISGGKAGDQTGKEVCIRDWYNKPWNVMIVCNDDEIAKKAAKYMQAICNDPDFGYDQSQRVTGYNEIVKHGGTVEAVSKAGPSEFDCSSLVSSCYRLAGVTEISPSNATGTMRNAFKSVKRNGKDLFTIYTDSAHVNTSDYARVGAIYLKEGSHVVMALDNGPKAGGSQSSVAKAPTYSVGKRYELQVELRVREGAGANTAAKTHAQLTESGKGKDADKNGQLDKGSKITCKEVKKIGNDIWIKSGTGWLAAYYDGKVYIK